MQNKPFLSLKERDRRYKLVRQAMRERSLDALLSRGQAHWTTAWESAWEIRC
jgi:hypothetical protein